MKILFLILIGLSPMLSLAVPESSVYPISGTTDAKTDENTDINPFPSPPIPPGAQKEEEKPSKRMDNFIKGPYDKDGNYLFVPKVREEKDESEM